VNLANYARGPRPKGEPLCCNGCETTDPSAFRNPLCDRFCISCRAIRRKAKLNRPYYIKYAKRRQQDPELRARDRAQKRKRERERYETEPGYRDHRRKRHAAWKLGIARSDVESLIEAKRRPCPICMRQRTVRHMAIDHDHKTGKVRGVICISCNTGIGQFRDDIEAMMRAVAYLKEHS
jgi:hypothetical protein